MLLDTRSVGAWNPVTIHGNTIKQANSFLDSDLSWRTHVSSEPQLINASIFLDKSESLVSAKYYVDFFFLLCYS